MVIELVGLEISVPTLIWTVINFFLLLFILNKFLFKPILKVMDERRAKINAGLARGEKAKEEMETAREQLRKEISDTNDKARELIYQSRADDERIRSEIIADADKRVKELKEEVRAKLNSRREAQKKEVDENMDHMVDMLKKTLLS